MLPKGVMAEGRNSDTSRTVRNPLLSAAGSGFPFENFSDRARLMPVSENSPAVLSEEVGEVGSFLGQDPPNSPLSIPGLIHPLSSISTDSKTSTTFFNDHQQPSGSLDSFKETPNFQAQLKPPQGYASQPYSLTQPQSFSGTNPLPSTSPSSYAPSSSPVLQIAPVSSTSSQAFLTSPPRADQSLPGERSYQSPQHGIVVGTTPSHSLADPDVSASATSGHHAVPLFETSALSANSSSSQLQHGHEVQSSSHSSSVPLLATSQYQQYQPTIKQENSIPHSVPTSCPQVNTVPPSAQSTNTYRLGNQRKPLYVQPPGLFASSRSTTPPIIPFSNLSLPTSVSYPVAPRVAMEVPQTSETATLTPTPLQYQSPVNAENQSPPSVVPPSFTNLAQVGAIYRPVYHHWFFRKEVETKVLWQPFSMVDSLALEEAFISTEIAPETLVPTDGGRYDVNILRRQKSSVYWQESPSEVRRCSWFYKGSTDTHYVPYEENVSTRLEEEFKIATTTNVWHRRVEFPNGETVVFHGPNVMVHFLQATSPDAWGNTPQTPSRPRVVKRGVDEFDIDEGEPVKIDHLLFLVHGIGPVCDLKFRTVEEVVDDFRSISLQLVQSHFHTAMEQGKVNRIEVLPISWHATLHGEDTGIDRKLKSITLNSIPKLRHFTNDTLLDILFYTSPVYCQTIMHTVGKELNRLYNLFRERNPTFEGSVSLGGHSLGSLILFDLLYHQKPVEEQLVCEPAPPSRDSSAERASLDDNKGTGAAATVPPAERKLNQRVSYVMGNAGTGQPFITYPQLNFQPKAFFALGSPIGMFVAVRGIETLGEDFRLPTCPGFFNIFHPFDPVAYRIETLVNPELTYLKPVLIPHHKGRKRMHLELKETMARVGADLKQRLMESVRNTWNTVYQLAMFHRSDDQALEQEVDKVLEEQLQQQQQSETDSCHSGTDGEADPDVCVGQLNGGRRIDYVLQEAPLESFNEYLFVLKTHVCYWESEDTMLMVLKEVYSTMGISADNQVLQQNTRAAFPVSSPSSYSNTSSDAIGTGPSHSVAEDKGTGLRGAQSDCSFMSSHIESSPVTTYPVDVQSSAALLTPPSGPIASSFLPSTSVNSCPPRMGMDPTAPPTENTNLGPPPVSGFVKK